MVSTSPITITVEILALFGTAGSREPPIVRPIFA
jgi:hypothetical protein